MHQITESFLKLGWKVKVLALETPKQRRDSFEIPEAYCLNTSFESHFVNTDIKPLDALIALISGNSYNVQRFYDPKLAQRLKDILLAEQFDAIHLEGLYLMPYCETIRKYSSAKLVMRAHNLEHQIWERLSETEPCIGKKLYFRHLAQALKRYEVQVMVQCDGLLAITSQISDFFRHQGFAGLVDTLPVAAIAESTPNIASFANRVVFHIGAMDWKPNQEGIQWFLTKVWPIVMQQDSTIRLHLAGRNIMSWSDKLKAENLTIDGEVPDAAAYAAGKPVMVVPLLSGSGMRVKIIEGLAWGKTIVTTSVGAEGTGCEHNKHLFACDSPQEMANRIVACFQDTEYSISVANHGHAFVMQNYQAEALTLVLGNFYKKLLMHSM